MAEASVAAVRIWAKRVKYPDLIDLQRVDIAYRDFPVRSSTFLQWLTSLSYQNSLASLNMTAEEFGSLVESDADTSLSQDSSGDGSSENEEEDSIDELTCDLAFINNTNLRLQKQIRHIERNLIKTETEIMNDCVLRNDTRYDGEKHFLEAHQLGLTVDEKSKLVLSIPRTSGERFEKLQLLIDDVIEIESRILRNIASTSASYFNDNRYVPRRIGTSSEKLEYPMKADRKSSLTADSNTSEALENDEEARKETVKRLQETRLKVLELFYFSTIEDAR